MMKRIRIFGTVLAIAIAFLCSCKESKEIGEYDNWKERNEEFIENIASLCQNYITQGITPQNAKKGDMFRLLSYKLDPAKEWGVSSYIYCQVLDDKRTGSVSPLSTDSVLINYRLRLMPTEKYPNGQIADQSFKTAQLDPAVNIPASFQISELVTGVTTALTNMMEGDTWRIYVPTGLGYGINERTNIPRYSALVFEINLVSFARTGASLPPK